MSALAIVPVMPETVSGLSRRLAELLEQSESEGVQGQLPDATREQATGLVEALRRRIVRKPDRDHRSLFDLDDRLIELMGLVEEAADAGGEISKELAQEIDTYLEAYRLKVDRIVGYWRWQQSIADISSKEAERLAARKKAAENRVTRLKGFLFAFMMARGIKKLEGEKSDIGMQRNSTASLVDRRSPANRRTTSSSGTSASTRPNCRRSSINWPKEKCAGVWKLALKDGWEVNGEAVRAALVNHEAIAGARLVTGSHVRIR